MHTLPSGLVYHIEMGDVDNDGFLDLLVGQVNRFSYIANSGSNTWPTTSTLATTTYSSFGVGDLDGDGDDDIVTNDNPTANVYWSDGAGGFTASPIFQDFSTGRNVKLGDFDNDGYLDVLTYHRLGQSLGYLIENVSGN